MATMAVTDLTQTEQSTVSWGAVIAGGMAAAAMSLFLLALGVGLGLSSISPWSDQGVSATTFKVGTGIYIVCVAMLSSTVGGYLAGRLRATWAGVHNDEIYFRDTAHGLLACGLCDDPGRDRAWPRPPLISWREPPQGWRPPRDNSGHVAGTADRHLRRYVAAHRAAAGGRRCASYEPSGAGAADPRAEVGR